MPITLEKMNDNHIPLFYKWWNNIELRKLTSNNYKKMAFSEIDDILQNALKNPNRFDFIINHNLTAIGHILIQKKPHKKNSELYIAIGEDTFWSKGYGSKAIHLASSWLFSNFPEESTLELEVNLDNLRAQKCYKKYGFTIIRKKISKNNPDRYIMQLKKAEILG